MSNKIHWLNLRKAIYNVPRTWFVVWCDEFNRSGGDGHCKDGLLHMVPKRREQEPCWVGHVGSTKAGLMADGGRGSMDIAFTAVLAGRKG